MTVKAIPASEQAWVLEAELESDPPRRIVAKPAKVRQLALLSIALVVFLVLVFLDALTEDSRTSRTLSLASGVLLPLVLAATVWIMERQSRLLVRTGTATRGVVETVRRKKAGWGIFWHELVVRYETPAGTFRVTWNRRDQLNVDDAVTVLYLPDAPKNALVYEDCVYRAAEPHP